MEQCSFSSAVSLGVVAGSFCARGLLEAHWRTDVAAAEAGVWFRPAENDLFVASSIGTGTRAGHTVGGILRLAGFKNVKSKVLQVVGSRHPRNTVKAVFQALSEIETPEEAAEREGRERVTHHA